jgi:hypothetical protein
MGERLKELWRLEVRGEISRLSREKSTSWRHAMCNREKKILVNDPELKVH